MISDKEIRNQAVLDRIRTILEQRGLSQRDFAKLLDKNEAEVSRWLSGRVVISRSSQEKIEKALGVAVSDDSTFRKDIGLIDIGVIGTGNIAERFVKEALHVDGVKVVAAYNPKRGETELFCDRYGIGMCCSSALELMKNVDAVYVASPIDTHYEYSRMALDNGRHLLCEMPFVSDVKEGAELIHLAAKKNLVLLTALKTAYCPSFSQLINMARSGIIGDVVDISATVTTLLPDTATVSFSNERMIENLSYPILAAFKLFGLSYKRINSFSRRSGERLLFTHSAIEYESGICSFKVGVGVKSEGSLVVSGTKGYIYVPAPWWKPDYFEVRFENPADNKKFFFPYEAEGLRYEIQALADMINRKSSIEYIKKDEILKMIEVQNKIANK